MKNTFHATQVYEITERYAGGNAIAQGVSGIFGCGVNLIVDMAAVPFYIQMWHEIRNEYGRGSITLESAFTFVRPSLPYIVKDIAFDKLAGLVPIIGIPLNVAYAKALTWRLGAWFGLQAVLGDEVSQKVLSRSTMQLVREFFPIEDMLDIWGMLTFQFKQPDKAHFVEFLCSLEGLPAGEVESRMSVALQALQGKRSESGEEMEEEHEWYEDEANETEDSEFDDEYALIPYVVDYSDVEISQEQAAQTPMLFLPATRTAYPTSDSGTSKPSDRHKSSNPTGKRRHVATGKPKGRPKTSGNAQKSLL